MKKIYIFLVASEETLEEERIEITNLIRSMNERYSTKNVRVRLFKTGEAMQYNPENLSDSEMVLLVCHKDISKEDLGCFKQALTYFQTREEPKTPRIITYFKSEEESRTNELVQFLTYLDSDLGHYYTEYQKTDSLKYHILLNLLTLEDSFVVEYKDNSIMIDGQSFGSLANMSCMSNHKQLQELKANFEVITTQFYDAMDAYDDDPTIENDNEYVRLGTLRTNMKKHIETVESNIFSAMIQLSKAVGNGELSSRSKEAYRLLELGDYERADAILDFSEIAQEIHHQLENLQAVEQTKQQVMATIRKKIDELLQKVETLKLRIDYPERFDQIKKCYQKAFETEMEAKLEPVATRAYVHFLQDQNDFEQTVSIIKMMNQFYEENDGYELGEMAAFNESGWTYRNIGEYAKAKECYQRAIIIGKALMIAMEYSDLDYVCTTNSKLAVQLSASYNELGIVYDDYGESTIAKEKYLKSLEIRKVLSKHYPNVYDIPLASSYGNIGNSCEEEMEYEQANDYYLLAIDNIKRNIENNGDENEYKLILHYSNLGNLYKTIGEYEKAENILCDALEISRKVAKLNPEAYDVKVADTLVHLGVLYFHIDEYEKASAMYLEAIDINDRLAERSYDTFGKGMVVNIYHLAVLYDYMGMDELAETLYGTTLSMFKDLKAASEELFEEDMDKISKRLYDLKYPIDEVKLEELNQYVYTQKEYAMNEILTYSGKGKPWVGNSYEILENEDNEILIYLPYTGPSCTVQPDDAKLFYDGKQHAILRGTGLPLIICDHIHVDIRAGIIKLKEVLIGFGDGVELTGDSVTAEFMAEVVYVPYLPISQKAELFVMENSNK